ncbi:eukaryotic translation initiation factor 3 subunit J [Radiomyces spectabilis]|uniref:eukaryotic translation initiation factor 3 subunit J n=1 Tax=Radiomyces spectabilis TaxID=64574 RepID=UPI002220CE09|nr:eukaryotic translation initiation factor 3 subunit J [Radiomyces spectabilis]KAI8393417.1 eukaryotic translation initiation factor 3 subunit J [Radiomyces spectabilis]
MSDWEEEQDFEIAIPKKQKWDDEDVEDDVKDSWEDSDEEEKKPAAPVVKKKVPLAQKIAEKKAAEEAKRKELEEKKAAMAKALEEETEEDAFERKQRLRNLELEADLNSATDLFAGVAVNDDKQKPIEEWKPKTRVEFEAYHKRLAEIIVAHSKSMNYANFVDQLARDLCAPMKDMDVRKVSSSLSAMANDKQRQAKEAQKSKKKGKDKPSLVGAGKPAARDDMETYNAYDDFDDFM